MAKTCSAEGCSRPIKARGYCPSHYNTLYYVPRFGKKPERYSHTCQGCGVEWINTRRESSWCPDCLPFARLKNTSTPIPWRECSHCSGWFVSRGGRRRCAPCLQPREAPRAITCQTCGRRLVVGDEVHPLARYCPRPAPCQQQAWSARHRERHPEQWRARRKRDKAKRRAAKKSADAETFDDVEIYDRDGWTCQLCQQRIPRDVHYLDPMAPTIDHIVPLARGGAHVRANVQAAHRSCNTAKGTRPLATGEQLRLVG